MADPKDSFEPDSFVADGTDDADSFQADSFEPETLLAGVPVPAPVAEADAGIGDAILSGANKLGEEAQVGIESALSPFGLRAPVAAAEALPNYLVDLVTPGVKSDFGRSFKQAEGDILARQERNTAGHLAGQAAQLIGTGGLGSAKAGAAAAALFPNLGRAGRFVTALGAEGAIQGSAISAANELDDLVENGNNKGVGERLAAVGVGTLLGFGTNIAAGGVLHGLGKVAGYLRKKGGELANDLAFKAVQGRTDSGAIKRLGGKKAALALGEFARESGIVTGNSLESIAERAVTQRDQVGRELGSLREQLGEAAGLAPTEALPTKQGVWDAVEAVLQPLRDNPGREATARAAERALKGIKSWAKTGGTATPDEIFSIRSGLDEELAGWHKTSPNQTTQTVRDARNAIERYYMESGDKLVEAAVKHRPAFSGARASSTAPTSEIHDLIARIADAKQRYSKLAPIASEAAKGLERRLANNKLPLRSAIAGAGALGGGLAGGGVGALAAGAATTFASKFITEQGESLGARMIGDAVKATQRLQGAAARFAPAGSQRALRTGAVYGAESLREMLDASESLQDAGSHETRLLNEHAQSVDEELGPQTSNAYRDAVLRRASFLLDKAGPNPPPSPFGKPQPRVFSSSEEEQLSGYAHAAEDPDGAFARLSAGDETPQDLETLQTLYPDMLQDFRKRVVERFQSDSRAPSYEDTIAIADRLGLPLLPEQQPEATAFWMQAAESTRQQQAAKSQAKAKLPDSRNTSERLG